MKRRLFLTSILGVLSYTLINKNIFAGNPHANHSPNMPMLPDDDHSMHSGTNMMHHEQIPLPTQALPRNQPLQALPVVTNRSSTPGKFQASLLAKNTTVSLVPGVHTDLWLYNDLITPLIEVQEGDEVSITLQNHLPQATTIHWHGLPVPAEEDGNPHDEVSAHDNKLYQFKLPSDCAATYWFHPHPHGKTHEQVFRGLAGALIVRSKNDPLLHLPEQTLMMTDLKLDEQGQIAENTMQDWMNGREGQFVLINGQLEPIITIEGTQRWRIINACSARYIKLALPNIAWQLVGTDGGLLESPVAMEQILLSPGERVELVVMPQTTGNFELVALAYNRGKMGKVEPEKNLTLASINVTNTRQREIPNRLRQIVPFAKPKAKKRVIYTETMSMEQGQHNMRFMINDQVFDMNRIDFISKINEVEEWEIVNNSHMDHSFHLHGTQFMVTETELDNKVTTSNFHAFKDTINLRPYETARIRTVQKHLGVRLYHCHILEHESLGMMGQLKVI